MLRKTPLLVREICWIAATVALYLSLGWFAWEIWSASLTIPRSLMELLIPVMPVITFIWIRRRIRRVVSGPLYRSGMQAYVIGEMRHT